MSGGGERVEVYGADMMMWGTGVDRKAVKRGTSYSLAVASSLDGTGGRRSRGAQRFQS
jgi:hypothetical protein